MSSIQRLATATPTSASQLPFNDPQNGRDSKASVADFAKVLQPLMTTLSGLITQYAAPNATGFSVTIAPPTLGASMFLLLSQGGAYAAGTVALPTGVDGQELVVHSRQIVTALTVSIAAADAANGVSSSGAPTTLAAGGFFRLRYDGINKLWCRVG